MEILQIRLEFEFYRNIFYDELDNFVNAFIQAQDIFPKDAPIVELKMNEDDVKMALMASGIDKKSRTKLIE